MIRASDPSLTATPQRVAINGESETTVSGNGFWPYLKTYWPLITQMPRTSFLSTGRELRCSPRSYSREMDHLHQVETDPQVRTAYLKNALDILPLDVLQTSIYIWGNENFDLICRLLANDAAKFRRLIEITPPEKYNYFPGHCTTKLQIEILLDDAFDDEAKLEQLTDIILTMIGDPRNGDEIDSLYYHYLKLLLGRQGSDCYVADRIRACDTLLAKEQVTALKKIENASLIANVLAQNLSGT